jgi:putative transposase
MPWAIDFMRGTLYSGRVFRTLNVLDEANRGALGIDVCPEHPGRTSHHVSITND